MHQITGIQSVKPGQHFDPEPDDAFFQKFWSAYWNLHDWGKINWFLIIIIDEAHGGQSDLQDAGSKIFYANS